MNRENSRVLLYLTNQCNLSCKHCFLKASPLGCQHLSWKQIEQTLDHYIKSGYHEITLSGGEATISPHLINAVAYAKKIGYQSIHINTNGINQQILNEVSPNDINLLIFSIDGCRPETHDYLRGEGAFARTLSTIKKAIKLKFRCSVIVTINKLNYDEIPQIITLLDNLKVSTISFNFLSPRGAAKENLNLLISPDKYRRIYNKIIKTKTNQYASIRIAKLFVTAKEAQQIVQDKQYQCLLKKPFKTDVFPDGKIYNCCLLSDFSQYSSGQVLDHKVIIDRTPETDLLKKYPESLCPAQQFELPDTPEISKTKLIPICLYYKTIIAPHKK